MISNTIEIVKIKKIGFLVTMDNEKASYSLDDNLSISALQKYDFSKNFISWVKVWLGDQKLCVLHGGTTARYSAWERHPPM